MKIKEDFLLIRHYKIKIKSQKVSNYKENPKKYLNKRKQKKIKFLLITKIEKTETESNEYN